MIEILKAQKEDSLQIAIVNVYTWKTQYSGLISEKILNSRIKNIRQTEEKIKSRIISDGNYLVAKKDNTVIGFCRYSKCENSGYEEYGEVNALYLLEGFKGQGIGRKLLEEAINNLKNMGYEKMRINCLKGNPSLDFYVHMGGKVIGEFDNILYGEEQIKENIILFDI